MSAQVVEIGEFRMRRERLSAREGCQHKKMTLNDQGEFVTCDGCKMQIGSYAALRMLVEQWAQLQSRVEAQREANAAVAAKTVELKAAQIVERAWRERKMVPDCPHCHVAIFPTDGFGRTMMNKEIALRRRAVEKQ